MLRKPLAAAAAALLAAVALTACGRGCGPAPTPEGVALSPLPEPPPLAIPEGALAAAGELAVVAARPVGPVEGEARPAITFSRPVVALGALDPAHDPAAGIAISPPVEGEWRWLGSATVELVPRAPLPLATRFTVTVPAGLRAVDGAALAAPYAFTFETPRPAVQRVLPREGYGWLAPTEPVSLVLDQPVKDLAAHLRVKVGGEDGWPYALKAVPVADEKPAAPGRRLPPPDPSARTGRDRRVRYELTPQRPYPLDTPVELRIEGALAGAEGPLTLEGAPRFALRTYGPLRVAAVEPCWWGGERCPRGPVRIRTTNPVDRATLAAAVTITPAVKIDWDEVEVTGPDASGAEVILPAAFAPGTRYRIAIAPALRDVFGQPLAERFERTFDTSDLEPELDAGEELALLEAGGDGALPVGATNLRSVEATLAPLDVPALARLLAKPDRADLGGGPTVSRTLDVSGPRNTGRTVPLPVRELLAGRNTTLFAVRVVAPELRVEQPWQRWRRERRIVGQLTDLAVHAKLGATRGVVWVTRLSDGKPVPGAELALHDRDGVERWRGRAGDDGLAQVPGLAEVIPPAGREPQYPWATPFALVAARAGGDLGVTLSSWSGGLDPAAQDVPTDWDGTEPRPLGGVFAERGIYRPGEKVHLKGLVRTRALGRIGTPARGKAAVTVLSARGKEIWSGEAALTPFGTWSAEVPIPADAPLGAFEVRARVEAGGAVLPYFAGFRVEEYRAPQFQVDVTAPAREVAAGEPLRAEVLARYLFGGAMPKAAVRWTATRESIDFQPPGHPGFAFGPQTWWWDDEAPRRTADVVASGAGETGDTGHLAIDAGKAEATGGRTFAVTLEAEVTDVNRQRIASRAAVTVHPAAVYAGVRRRGTGFAEAGRPGELEVIAAAPDGAVRAGIAVDLVVKKREWRWIRKKGVGGRWVTESEVVEERAGGCALRTREEPVACAFTPPAPALYVAEATLKDAQGRTQVTRFPFYAAGPGWVSWQREDTGRIDLVPDRPSYQPGEVAKVLVKSPFPRAEAILTVEREGVLSARRVTLEGSATTLEVPLGEDAIPNVFVSVLLVRGRVAAAEAGGEAPGGAGADPGRPEVRVGYAKLAVERRAKRLQVAVEPDRAEKRPREPVELRVRVTDHAGKGAPAEVTVWAVDEGILRLTGYEPPDPVALVHPERGLSVRLGESLIHLVERRRYGEKGRSPGGGGGGEGAGAGFRTRFETTVLFAPEVHTDGEGRATVRFTAPDNLTTWRIMAVAVSRGDRMGVGRSKVTVSKPLLALPALPRLARVGDRFEAGVVVHAPGAPAQEVEVRAEASGLVLDGPAVKQVRLDGAPREVRFAFRAEAPGEAVLRFAARGAAGQDGVEQRLPVRLAVEQEAVAVSGDTRDRRREALAPPAGARPDVGGLEVRLASTALAGFSEGMRQLVEYPYGCLEQLSSRLVPFIALRELQGRLGLRHLPGERAPAAPAWARAWLGDEVFRIQETDDPDEVVRRTVKAIERLQGPDGGYRYWASSECSAAWASSYAVLALGRAAELGYPVDRAALSRGQQYLAGTVAAGRCTRCGGSCAAPDDPTRVFALYALARTRAPKASFHAELVARRAALPLFSQAMLADALLVTGSRDEGRRVLQEVLNHVKESPTEAHLEEADPRTYAPLWSSDTRTTGIVLGTLASTLPDHPYVPKMAAWLGGVRRADGRFRNTQEAAFALLALSEVMRTREKDVPDFTARVSLAGAEVASARFAGRSAEAVRREVPMSRLPRGGGALDFARDGAAGVLYYGAVLRWAPAELPREPLERGIHVQRWIEPYQGGGQVRAVAAGDLVRIRVRLGTSQERHHVAVSVPVPAGLEIVDTSLATTAAVPAPAATEVDGGDGEGEEYAWESAEDLSEEEAGPPAGWAFRFWSPFNHQERRDDRLVLFADALPPGLHVATFVARATTPGTFLLAPARAEEMYAPEVFGRSDAGTFEVRAGGGR